MHEENTFWKVETVVLVKDRIITTAIISSYHNNFFLINDTPLLKLVAFNVALFDDALLHLALFDAALFDFERFLNCAI